VFGRWLRNATSTSKLGIKTVNLGKMAEGKSCFSQERAAGGARRGQ